MPSKTRLTFAQTVRSNPRLRMDLTIPREQKPARDSVGESASNPVRMGLFYVTLLVAVGVLIARLLILQVVQDATYVEQAFENRVSRISEPAPRGIIYDRRGVPLVINVPAYNVVITPASLPDNEAQVEAMYRRLSDLLDMPVTVPGSTPQQPCTPGRGIRDLVEEGEGFKPYTPVKIKCDIDKGTALIIREELATMPGVDVVVEPFREYPTRSLTASIVGYMAPIPDPNESEYFKSIYDYYVGLGLEPDRDRIGVSGIEASMQDILAGQNSSMLVERDVAGQVLRVLEVERPTIAGQNVQLTVDARLQAAAEAALTHRIDYINTFLGKTISASGVVIAMNPQTGEILAMVTWPTFDNNRFARVIDYPYYQQLADDPLHPLVNHAVSGLYPPGSVFKMVTATGVLEEGVIDPKRQLDDPGKITIKISYAAADPDARTQDFVCWLRSGHGLV
ncbi:MAG: penicillin-binding transpeptidase domain-containing protein, partial [Anaerolineales bacterium]